MPVVQVSSYKASRELSCGPAAAATWSVLARWVRLNLFLVCVLSGGVLGGLLGVLLRPLQPGDQALLLIGFPGEIFLRTFKLFLLPLVISSIATASSTLNAKTNGKMAAVTFTYFLVSSFASAVIGLLMVLAIHPGSPLLMQEELLSSQTASHPAAGKRTHLLDTILDLIRNMLPENIVQACLQQVQTVYTPFELNKFIDTSSNFTTNATFIEYKRDLMYRNSANYLGLILFFFVLGTVLGSMGEKGKPLAKLFSTLDSAILIIITKFSWFTPIGVASLICERIVSLSRLDQLAAQLGIYVVTVIATLSVHGFIFIPLVYFIFVRKNPYTMITNVFQALFSGFATDSSAIALPLTLQCMEEKMKVDRRVTRFVLPLGVTINMDGTAAFLTLAAVFLAQMRGIEPTPGELMSVMFSATLASVATVAAPSASLFLLGIVMTGINGVNTDDIALLFAIDWLLSRCRAISNVLGDCCGAVIVEKICARDLLDSAALSESVRVNNDDSATLKTIKIHDVGNGECNMNEMQSLTLNPTLNPS